MEENKYKKDVADPDVNVQKLNDIFDVMETGELVNATTGEVIEVDVDSAVAEVKEMREELQAIEKDMPDIDGIILDNIKRANRFLDKIEKDVMTGNGSAVMMESTATLINAVTQAATSITGISYNNDIVAIRREELRLREKKLTIEAIKGGTPTQVTGDVNITNNSLTMTREELLKELRDDKK